MLKITKRMSPNSFSLIESLIVVFILALLFTINIPNIAFFEKQLLKGEVDRIVSTINLLRQKAIVKNKTIDLYLSKNSIHYTDNQKLNRYKLTSRIKFGFIKGSKGPPSNPKALISTIGTYQLNKNNEYILKIFNDGKISPGLIYLTNQKETFMACISTPISQISLIRKYILTNNNKWILF